MKPLSEDNGFFICLTKGEFILSYFYAIMAERRLLNMLGSKNSFLRDLEVKRFDNLQELHEFLNTRTNTDLWITDYSYENKVVGIPNNPICLAQIKSDITNLVATDEAMYECMENMGLLLTFPGPNDGRLITMPLRYTAYNSLFERAGLTGRTIRNSVCKKNCKALEPAIKAEWLTTALGLYPDKCQILVRDGKVSTIRSSQYQILDTEELVAELELALAMDWQIFKMQSAEASHECTVIRYVIKDEEAEKRIVACLAGINLPSDKVEIGVKFVTSDIGDSAATLYPFLILKDLEIQLGDTLKLTHNADATIKKWSDEILTRLASLTKDSVDKIISLSKIKIKNIGGCLRNIACHVGLPKEASIRVGEEIESMYMGPCTALDIYYGLFEIVNRNEEKLLKAGSQYSPSQLLKYQELCAQALSLDFEELDIPFEWK